ncbi:MAG: glycoside hydrolase family 43 protein [Lachnospiraceae bacterium]|jgi:beta-xylosidase|nr:glycoside hydrolase family 43 protein [Lachnospiraceae bacterium]
MKAQEIYIRDPFILLHDGIYYMYGTRSQTAWGPAEGFDVYTGSSLKEWDGPFEIFHNDGTFWATECYWAPECVYYKNNFYLISTFGAKGRKKGIQLLISSSPLGPFKPLTNDTVTPKDWSCIDGSLLIDDNGKPFLLFSHSFPEELRGAVCAMPLSDDLRQSAGTPVTLFYADEAVWAKPVPFAKTEFGIDSNVYFSDGPYAYYQGDTHSLHMIWSSWGMHGYAIGLAVSESGKITGPWKQRKDPLFAENGGHGMILQTADGLQKLVLHYPNDKMKEHPIIIDIEES